jgi:hypothetical protein
MAWRGGLTPLPREAALAMPLPCPCHARANAMSKKFDVRFPMVGLGARLGGLELGIEENWHFETRKEDGRMEGSLSTPSDARCKAYQNSREPTLICVKKHKSHPGVTK